MTRVTQAQIDEMRSRGYDPATIREAEACLRRGRQADALCERVREAFAGVRLGDGVGLFEGQAIDGYSTTEQQRLAREKDEKHLWENIETKHLNACFSSLSFFDALGMRFHLPAFLTAELEGEFDMGLVFTLTYQDFQDRKKFGLLNLEQRQVVRAFLILLQSDPDAEHFAADIDRALRGYWTEQP